jgi:predicted metalloprotease with PDZ domain
MTTIHYTITPSHPGAHLFEVTCSIAAPDPAGQQFSLPAWIPGSYMIREFARNIVRIRAESTGQAVSLRKLDKHTWQAAPCNATLTLTYEVYAWDMSVRCAHLDKTQGFFNGTQVFVAVAGAEQGEHLVELRPPRDGIGRDWRVATTLPEATGKKGAAKRGGFGWYRATNYDELIDHPVAMGVFSSAGFTSCGVPHEIVIAGRIRADIQRLTADLARICATHIAMFGEHPPFERYVFMVHAIGEGHGGLEHRSSTALICARDDLPSINHKKMSDGYANFLSLCSHEYFHSWNVKRIKPSAFMPYDLSRENHTALLWAFEGFTSYYDDLGLRRAGVIAAEAYLARLASTISNVEKGSGRHKQSLAESSFDAWIKYYRQDENSPNAIVSYYDKGALVALCLDLFLRSKTDGRVSLDDVMRELWRSFGKVGRGVPEDGIRQVAEALSGLSLRRFFAAAVDGTGDLPLKRLLKAAGIVLGFDPASANPSLAIKATAEGNVLRLSQVFDGGAAQQAGLSAGDTLVAIDGLRVNSGNLETLLARYQAGDTITIHAFRRDELMTCSVLLQAAAKNVCKLSSISRPTPAQLALREKWLGTE